MWEVGVGGILVRIRLLQLILAADDHVELVICSTWNDGIVGIGNPQARISPKLAT